MIIENTELEYDEAEACCLDYYLGGTAENKDQWAQRVWNNCNLYKTNNGLDENGNPLPNVYAQDPKFLWEQKKRRRRVAIFKELKNISMDSELCECKKVREDLKNGVKASWSSELSDSAALELKNDPNYKTRDQKDAELKAEYDAEAASSKKDVETKLAKLREKGFDDETIKIIYPVSEGIIDEAL